jgi:hypothetical protein
MVLPDTRSERSKEMILSNETYEMLETEIRSKLLPTTKHLVIVLGTPLVYPALKFFEDALEKLGDKLSRGSVIGKVFGKCKAFENVLGQFGPELLDDLVSTSSFIVIFGCCCYSGLFEMSEYENRLFLLTHTSPLAHHVSLVFHFCSHFISQVDSWACTVHTEEKRRMVEMLQAIAVERSVRVTFVGGDVSCIAWLLFAFFYYALF